MSSPSISDFFLEQSIPLVDRAINIEGYENPVAYITSSCTTNVWVCKKCEATHPSYGAIFDHKSGCTIKKDCARYQNPNMIYLLSPDDKGFYIFPFKAEEVENIRKLAKEKFESLLTALKNDPEKLASVIDSLMQ